MRLLGGFGRSAGMRGWAALDGLRSKELIQYKLNIQVPRGLTFRSRPTTWTRDQMKTRRRMLSCLPLWLLPLPGTTCQFLGAAAQTNIKAGAHCT